LRSDEYKAKLNAMMKKMIEEDKSDEEVTPELEEVIEEVVGIFYILPLVQPTPHYRVGNMKHVILIPSIEIRLPAIIEKFMTYCWCPFDELFYPKQELRPGDPIVLHSNGIEN
jgi:hypothetical protein